MENEVLLALIFKKVEEKLKDASSPSRGPRGQRGARGGTGVDGKDFVFTEHEPKIREILSGALPSIEDLRGPRGRDGRDGKDGERGDKGDTFRFEDLSKEQVDQLKGDRGRDGRDGTDGKDFVLADHEEVIKNWAREFALRFEDLSHEQREALRGARGRDGKDGRDFDFSEHAETIKSWVEEFRLRFEDLNEEQVATLRGADGRDGKDGRDFEITEHAETLRAWAKEFAIKFSDLTSEEIASLRGPRGRDGRDGKDGAGFDFEAHRDSIKKMVAGLVGEIRGQLKLRFEDLTAEDIDQLRGPRGRDGKDGKDFIFEDHVDFFSTLRPKFSDFTAEERELITLKFSHLTDAEKDRLKLRFEDLNDEQRLSLRGARGARGQRGSQGPAGKDGLSIRGLPGVIGPRGFQGPPGEDGEDGIDGEDGEDGDDAPTITSVGIDQYRKDVFEFIFGFSDGSEIRSDPVKFQAPKNHYYFDGGSSGGGGSSTTQDLGNAKNAFNLAPVWDSIAGTTTYTLPEIPLSDDDTTIWLSGSMRTDYTLNVNDIIFNFDARDQVCDAHFRWGSSTVTSFKSKIKSLTGNWDGTYTTYILPVTPISNDEIVVMLSGSMRNDYTLTGNKVTFNFDSTDQVFDAEVRYGASSSSSSMMKVKALTGSWNGSDTTYTLPASPISYDELTVWLSGSERTDYSFSGNNVTFVGQDTRDQVFDAQFRH